MNAPQAEKIGRMFDSIAPDYDRLNHLLSFNVDRMWRSRAMSAVFSACPDRSASEGDHGDRVLKVLDVACGTGDFSIAMARKFRKKVGKLPAKNIKIVGLDLSEGMLSVMKDKVEAAGLGDVITLMQGNGENMPFADNTFDAVSIAFGIRNFEHREQALREILRVLRPGGRLVILELSVPENAFLRWGYCLYFRNILPKIGGKISGDKSAYNYLPASVLGFPGKEEWMSIMVSCGYSDIAHKAFTFEICRLYTALKPSI